MAGRAVRDGEISIDGKLYRLAGNKRVTLFLASQHPGKVVEGEYTDESNPLASAVSWQDITAGIGKEIYQTQEDTKRTWWSTANQRHTLGAILPVRATAIAQATASDVEVLADFGEEVFQCIGTAVYLYNAYANTHSNVHTLLGTATDWTRGNLYPSEAWTDTLVIASGSGVDYATASDTWLQNSDIAIKYVIFHAGLLWGITNAGRLYYTDDLSSDWSADAQLELPSGSVVGLRRARGPDGEFHLYAVTKQGYYVHIPDHARFEPTDFADLPYHPDGGSGAGNWRGAHVYPAGSGMYMVDFRPDARAAVAFGPDQDHGLPEGKRGTIIATAESHNELFAALEATIGSGFWELGETDEGFYTSGGAGSSRIGVFGVETGYSMVLGWNQRGWQVAWLGGAGERPITAMLVSSAYNTYNLWFASNQYVYRLPLPMDVVNPLKLPTSEYGADARIEYPWFTAGTPNQKKNALTIVVETTNPSTSETVATYYGLDWDEDTWYSAGDTITESGETIFYLGTLRKGKPFRAIRLRNDLARAAANIRSTPIVRLTGLTYEKNIKTLWGIQAYIDITEDQSDDGREALTTLADLRAVMKGSATGELVEITYKDDTSDLQNYYMRPRTLRIVEGTGTEHDGTAFFEAVEPGQSTSR